MTLFQRRFPVSVHGRRAISLTLAVLTALMLGVFPTPASAGLILQVENASAQAGGTGSFDVVIYSTSGSFDVSGFQVELSVGGSSGVTFTDASVNTAAPYIFTSFQSSPPFALSSLPTTDLIVSDADMTSPGVVTVSSSPAVTYGIEHVTFAVAAGTPDGPVTVSILAGTNGLTQIYDINGNPFPITAMNGTINVESSAIPEPSSLLMGFVSFGVVGGAILFKRRIARKV
jgi:hypothetical protein